MTGNRNAFTLIQNWIILLVITIYMVSVLSASRRKRLICSLYRSRLTLHHIYQKDHECWQKHGNKQWSNYIKWKFDIVRRQSLGESVPYKVQSVVAATSRDWYGRWVVFAIKSSTSELSPMSLKFGPDIYNLYRKKNRADATKLTSNTKTSKSKT